MPRNWIGALCLATSLMAVSPAPWAQAGGAGEALLPATTRGFLSITNLSDLSADWNKTQLGQLMDDPVMRPFSEDLRRQLQNRWSGMRDTLGLTLDDLEGVPGGELSMAVIEVASQQAAVAMLIDVTNRQAEAQGLLKKVTARLTGQGAKQTVGNIAQTPVLVFDLPNETRHTYYFLKENLLGASNDPGVIQTVLLRQGGQQGESLAGVPAFQGVMARVQKDAGDQVPHIRWFIEPIPYLELRRASRPPEERRRTRRGKDMFDVAKRQGFTGIQGIGGFLSVGAEPTQVVHRTAVFAPPPREKSMKMLKFVNNGDFTPPSWIPREIATYTTFCIDLLGAFDNFGPLFDELFGEGEKGVWKDTLEGLRDDPDGPRIDLRGELFVNLGTRIIVLTDYRLPITTTSERLLYAIETKDEKKVAAAIRKAMEKDETMRRREFLGHVIWESIPQQKKPAHAPVIELGRVPALGPDAAQEDEEEMARLLPNQAITVANGHLLVASHYDFLTKILKPVEPQQTLAQDIDYRVIEAVNAKLGAGQDFLRAFSRTDEEYRPTYEMVRQGKMPESETMLARLLNNFGGNPKGDVPRKQQIDGSKMPDFDYVRRNLGPGGGFGTVDENGWFFKGYILPKP